MANKTVLATRNVFNVAENLTELHEYFRVMNEMLVDQLCAYNVDDLESMDQSLERIHFLVNLIPEKLTRMTELSADLYALSKAQKQDVIAA